MTFFASEDEECAYVASAVMALERQLGKELHPNVVEALIGRTLDRADEGDGMIDVQGAWDELEEEAAGWAAEDAWDTEFSDGLSQLEAKLGRELFDSEVHELHGHTSEVDVDPIKTFERLHGGKDPFNDPDNPDRSRIARANAAAEQVYSHQEFEADMEQDDGEEEDTPTPGELVDPEARRAWAVEVADRAYAEQGVDADGAVVIVEKADA